MRQKRIKGVDETRLKTRGVITDIHAIQLPNKRLEIEIGSGKGDFITSLALDHKETHFIAIEKNKYVCYRMLEKKENLNIENLTIILGDAIHLSDYMAHRKVDVIYLNFSDPWPKTKHHKRRLTAESFLPLYTSILNDNGILQFRTDHINFFNDSIDTLSTAFEIYDINRNLDVTKYMTEYEVKKRKIGPIYQLKGKKKHVANTL